jgi:hypothetical protein
MSEIINAFGWSGLDKTQNQAFNSPNIRIFDASFGSNCDPQYTDTIVRNNIDVKNKIKAMCNKNSQCAINVNKSEFGDPVPSCAKQFNVLYTCANNKTKSALTLPDQSTVNISCEKFNVVGKDGFVYKRLPPCRWHADKCPYYWDCRPDLRCPSGLEQAFYTINGQFQVFDPLKIN